MNPISDSRGAMVLNSAELVRELVKRAVRESRNVDQLKERLFRTIKVVRRAIPDHVSRALECHSSTPGREHE